MFSDSRGGMQTTVVMGLVSDPVLTRVRERPWWCSRPNEAHLQLIGSFGLPY